MIKIIKGYARDNFVEDLKVRDRANRDRLAELSRASAIEAPPRNDLLPSLNVVEKEITALKPMPRNVRKIDHAHVREVAKSIQATGVCAPVIIGKSDEIINGVIVVEAAKLLGLTTVPCVRLTHLSDDEVRVLRLALNRLGEKGCWLPDEMKIEVEELIAVKAPIEVAGFARAELDQILGVSQITGLEDGPLEPDAERGTARCGDVYRLGRHRVMCGDATQPEVLLALLSDEQVRFVFTDVPFNVKIEGNVTRGPHRAFVMASGDMSDQQFAEFNNSWIKAALVHLSDGGVFGTFIDWRGQPIIHAAALQQGLVPLNLVVWTKTNAGMGSLYRSQHELLPLFKKGAGPHCNNIQLGKHGRWRSNVWTYPGASSLGSDARRGLKDHPTVKPVAMLADALLDLTQRDEIVLDPFLGSGSTLMAAEQTGRRCYGLELDPLYVDVICRRYQAMTGTAAVLAETGESFDDVAHRRAAEADPINVRPPASPPRRRRP